MIDIQKIRKDTPHCEDKLFFNSAGASLVPSIVTQRMISYLEEESRLGGYALGLGDRIQNEIQEFYTEVAKMLHCEVRNVAYSINATDGYAQSLSSIPFEKGDVIITTDDDYISNHAQFSRLYAQDGVYTVRVQNEEDGSINLNHFQELILEHKPRLVSITHIPTNTGKIQDIEAVGRLCEEHDILYIVDACQSAGQMPLDVQKIKCDFLAASGRKFLRGPRGTGFLYVSDKVLDRGYTPLRVDGRGVTWIAPTKFQPGDNAIRFETWEQNYACVLGLKEAVRYANNIGLESIFDYNQKLLNYLRNCLTNVDGIKLLDEGLRLSNIVTFTSNKMSKDDLIAYLESENVFFSVMNRGNALIDFDKKEVDWCIRLSPHYYNTKEEIDHFETIIQDI